MVVKSESGLHYDRDAVTMIRLGELAAGYDGSI